MTLARFVEVAACHYSHLSAAMTATGKVCTVYVSTPFVQSPLVNSLQGFSTHESVYPSRALSSTFSIVTNCFPKLIEWLQPEMLFYSQENIIF